MQYDAGRDVLVFKQAIIKANAQRMGMLPTHASADLCVLTIDSGNVVCRERPFSNRGGNLRRLAGEERRAAMEVSARK
jgi:hypothetical protein